MYMKAPTAVFAWAMGITHHEHGVANVQSIVNLALLRGMAGKPRAGLMPIRGHSNVQGIGSVGVAPDLKQPILDNLETYLKIKLPVRPGLDTMGCMKAAEQGAIHSAVCLGGNLFGSNPDAKFAMRALSKLDLIAYLSTSLNTGHAWGRARETLILPVRARDEEPEPTTQESMFNYVRLSDGGPSRFEGPRSEVEVIASIGERVLGERSPVDWKELRRHCHLPQMIGHITPCDEKIRDIDQTHEEFQLDGRTFHTPRFNTPSEIAQLAACGVTAVSQTAGPETVLCGELELPFGLIGFVTDFAVMGGSLPRTAEPTTRSRLFRKRSG